MNFRRLLLTPFIVCIAQLASAADPVNTTWIGNLAVEGYDTVAYFTDGEAVEGRKEHQTEWMDANWRFATEDHLQMFLANPEKYAPQYGGYCAYAVSNDGLAGIDPEQFHIYEGKLYLNYNAKIQQQWLPEKLQRIEAANENFPNLVD